VPPSPCSMPYATRWTVLNKLESRLVTSTRRYRCFRTARAAAGAEPYDPGSIGAAGATLMDGATSPGLTAARSTFSCIWSALLVRCAG
jgi:hypothetical protein